MREPLLVLSFGVLSCSGYVQGSAGPEQPADVAGAAAPDGRPMAGAGNRPSTPGAAPPGACSGVTPGSAPLRRLTNDEYARVVRDLLGATGNAAASFPADAILQGFSNHAELQTISVAHAESYRDAAERLAAAATETPGRRASVIGCEATGATRDACLRSFIERFGRHALRRPLAADEITDLLTVASSATGDPDPYAAPRLVITALLQSSSFLFRPEVGVPDPARPGLARLGGYEQATRLAFLLWGTTPDDHLLDAARDGVLDSVAGLERTARDMLADPRAREGLRGFARDWLRLRDLDGASRDPRRFPLWNDSLRGAMAEETLRLVDDLAWTDGATFLDLLTTRASFVDAQLARLYGVAAPQGATFTRVDLGVQQRRSGVLTQPSVLTVTSKNDAPSAIKRGKFLREVILCQALPPPPPEVIGMTVPPLPGETEREYLARHRSQPACNGCHALLEPLGFGLDEYDAIGAFRKVDGQGKPVDPRGSATGLTEPDFVGAVELGQKLRSAPGQIASCVATQAFRFGFGRADLPSDACTIDQAQRAFTDGKGSVRELLIAFVRSDAFRMRPLPVANGGAP